MPLTLFAQRKYPTGITPYTLQKISEYANGNDIEKAESILSSLGYKYTSYKENFIGGTATYTRKTKDGYGSKIYWTIGTGQCQFFSVNFFTSKGSNYFVSLLRKSKYKLYYYKGDKIWHQSNLVDPSSDEADDGIVQSGRKFDLIYTCA